MASQLPGPDVPFVGSDRERDIRKFVNGVAKLCKKYDVSLGTCDGYLTVTEEGREYPDGYTWSAALEGIDSGGPVDLDIADWVDEDRPEEGATNADTAS